MKVPASGPSKSAVEKNEDFILSRPPRVLLIPTLEARKTIAETLCSLVSSQALFDDVIISVNGLSSDNVQTIIDRSGFGCGRQIHVLCTRKVIPAIQHSKFIVNYIRSVCSDESLIFLLADDDLVPPSCNINEYLKSCGRSLDAAVGMGNFVSFVDQQEVFADQPQHLLPGEQVTALEFLRRNKQGHLFTNMSSMVVPCYLFCEAVNFMAFWGSAGRRFEYILATHRDVALLFSPSFPSALIRHHPRQEGRTLSRASMLHDELIYIVWVWLNQPLTRPWSDLQNKYGFTLIRFVCVAVSLLRLRLLRLLCVGEPAQGFTS
jgi:hypothetical protein